MAKGMQRVKRMSVCFLMAFALVLSMFTGVRPAASVVQAADTNYGIVWAEGTTDNDATRVGTYVDANGVTQSITFTRWDSDNSLPTAGGAYYLATDVTIEHTWYVNNDTTLCLNGHTVSIEGRDEEEFFGIHDGIEINPGITFNMFDTIENLGKLTGDKCSIYIEGLITGTLAYFNMYGGNITGINSDDGIISSRGRFVMYGGAITKNNVEQCVWIASGNFIMNGGEISDNHYKKYYSFAGTVILPNDDSVFIMNGGSIINNSSENHIGGIFLSYGKFEMNGGLISGNTLSGEKSNLYIKRSQYNQNLIETLINGGTIDGGIIEDEVVTFFANDGTDDKSYQIIRKDKETELKTNTFTNEGKAFVNWNTEPDGSGTSYEDGQKVTLKEDLVLYAQWECDHDISMVEQKKATCTEDGNIEYWVCDRCGTIYNSEAKEKILEEEDTVVQATGHDWGEWIETKAATETTEGSETRTCKNDPTHTETRSIPVLGHEHTLVKTSAKAATCTEEGNIEYWTCSGCGRYFSDSEGKTEINKEDTVVAKKGHDWGDWVVTKEPTADEEGVETCTCKNDISHTKTRTIDKLEPDEEPEDVIPEAPSDNSKKDLTPEKTSEPESYSNEWIKGVWYNSDGTQTYAFRGHWEENEIGYWYIDDSGWYPKEQWQKIDGKWYYFNAAGFMCINQYAGEWTDLGGTYWWVGEDGAWDEKAPGYWGFADGKWFFYNATGWVAENSWWHIGQRWYWFDADGWLAAAE